MGDFLEEMMVPDTEDTSDFLAMAMSMDDDADFLAHHGVSGMHWYGRRYQNEDGSLTLLGRIHYGVGNAREKRAVRKAQKAEKAEAARAKKVEKAEAARAKKVEELSRKGDVNVIYKNRKLFTRDEMKDAIARASELQKFKSTGKSASQEAIKKQMLTAQEKIDKLVKAAGTVATVYAAYNTLAKEVNSVTGENTLPNFGTMSAKYWSEHKKDPYQPTNDKSGAQSYKSHVTKKGSETEEDQKKEDQKKEGPYKWSDEKKEGPYKWSDEKTEASVNDLLYTYGSKKAKTSSLVPGVSVGPEGGIRKVSLRESIRDTATASITDLPISEVIKATRRANYGGGGNASAEIKKAEEQYRKDTVKRMAVAASTKTKPEWRRADENLPMKWKTETDTRHNIIGGESFDLANTMSAITGTSDFDWKGEASNTSMKVLQDLLYVAHKGME